MDHKQLENQPWPKEGLEQVDRCPVCGEMGRTLLYDKLVDDVMFCAPGHWSLYKCQACNAAYLDPRPTPATISLAYRNYHTHYSIESSTPNKIGKLRKSLRNGYINYKLKANLIPEMKIGRWLVPLLMQSRRIDESIRHIPKGCRSKIIADIGCGNGQFLQTAIQLGLEAYGLDFDPLAVEIARKAGASVSLGGLPNTGWPSSKFDMVTLSHVIEHVHDPMLALQEVRRILKPGGLVWIATPNMDSFGHNRFRRYWRGIEPPRHLVLFNRTNIKMLLEASGFVNIMYKPCHPQTFWFYKASLKVKEKGGNRSQTKLIDIITQYNAFIANIMETYIPSKCENLVIMAESPVNEGYKNG